MIFIMDFKQMWGSSRIVPSSAASNRWRELGQHRPATVQAAVRPRNMLS